MKFELFVFVSLLELIVAAQLRPNIVVIVADDLVSQDKKELIPLACLVDIPKLNQILCHTEKNIILSDKISPNYLGFNLCISLFVNI